MRTWIHVSSRSNTSVKGSSSWTYPSSWETSVSAKQKTSFSGLTGGQEWQVGWGRRPGSPESAAFQRRMQNGSSSWCPEQARWSCSRLPAVALHVSAAHHQAADMSAHMSAAAQHHKVAMHVQRLPTFAKLVVKVFVWQALEATPVSSLCCCLQAVNWQTHNEQ